MPKVENAGGEGGRSIGLGTEKSNCEVQHCEFVNGIKGWELQECDLHLHLNQIVICFLIENIPSKVIMDALFLATSLRCFNCVTFLFFFLSAREHRPSINGPKTDAARRRRRQLQHANERRPDNRLVLRLQLPSPLLVPGPLPSSETETETETEKKLKKKQQHPKISIGAWPSFFNVVFSLLFSAWLNFFVFFLFVVNDEPESPLAVRRVARTVETSDNSALLVWHPPTSVLCPPFPPRTSSDRPTSAIIAGKTPRLAF